jgi:hypothetical protein
LATLTAIDANLSVGFDIKNRMRFLVLTPRAKGKSASKEPLVIAAKETAKDVLFTEIRDVLFVAQKPNHNSASASKPRVTAFLLHCL